MPRQKIGDTETCLEVRSFDAPIPLNEYNKLPKKPLYIILDNLRSAFNVGSIFRLCDAMRVSGLFLCGYTACPPNLKLLKTSLGTIDYVPWKTFENAVDAVDYLHSNQIEVWAAETTSRSEKYDCVDFPKALGVVFGNEALGVSRDVLEKCDSIIEIPLNGFKNSINVAASCAVIGFEILKQFEAKS
ncbi:RNA methyltransferase [Chitinispirillales bacterium ANBcel5]|uniref:RNA methyltransferase n=1 Tax=Cellulosispirillum alkaliphilum TaxID=3039283 RepID=UPI002A4F4A17|nr:RNA methyltransferase [Chitinispirillales bacterium ANBcel5]